MSNEFQNDVTKAWSTYCQTYAKYRTSDYTSLIESNVTAFIKQLGDVDSVLSALKASKPASETALESAETTFSELSDTLSLIGESMSQFPEMDNKAINRAATLDQAALRKTYTEIQGADEALFAMFATTLTNAQEKAARSIGVYASSPGQKT